MRCHRGRSAYLPRGDTLGLLRRRRNRYALICLCYYKTDCCWTITVQCSYTHAASALWTKYPLLQLVDAVCAVICNGVSRPEKFKQIVGFQTQIPWQFVSLKLYNVYSYLGPKKHTPTSYNLTLIQFCVSHIKLNASYTAVSAMSYLSTVETATTVYGL